MMGFPKHFFDAGQKHGFSVILGHTRMPLTKSARANGSRSGARALSLRCECGNEYVRLVTEVLRGRGLHCGCKSIKRDVPRRQYAVKGDEFSDLLVIDPDYVGTDSWRRYMLVQCICGHIKQARTYDLIAGKNHHCATHPNCHYGPNPSEWASFGLDPQDPILLSRRFESFSEILETVDNCPNGVRNVSW